MFVAQVVSAAEVSAPPSFDPSAQFRQAQTDAFHDSAGAQARVLDLVRRVPDFPEIDHAYFWLGESLIAHGDPAQGESFFRQAIARFPRSRWAFQAQNALGNMEMARKNYAAAATHFRAATGSPDPEIRDDATRALDRAQDWVFRLRSLPVVVVAVILTWAFLLFSLARLPGGLRSALRPVLETWLFLALSVALMVAARAIDYLHIAVHVGTLAVFLVSIQLSGALLRRRSFGLGKKIAYLAIGGLVGFGVLYAARVRTGEVAQIAEMIGDGD